jgi:hypothetical protein
MCVLSIREHNPDAPKRTITSVVSNENPKAAWAALRDNACQGRSRRTDFQPSTVVQRDAAPSLDFFVLALFPIFCIF